VRVSTPHQQVNEQVVLNRGYANAHGINIIAQYGDYGKRHKVSQRKSFQAMLTDIATMKPNYILIQRLDRFGVADPNQLAYFLEVLKQNKVRLITTVDGRDRSRIDLATMVENVVGAAQSRQEQIDKAERVLIGKRKTALSGEYIGGKYLARVPLLQRFHVGCVALIARVRESPRALSRPEMVGHCRAACGQAVLCGRDGHRALLTAEWRPLFCARRTGAL
jgi:hypothetical protein